MVTAMVRRRPHAERSGVSSFRLLLCVGVLRGTCKMELAEKWVGLFRRHDDANPNSVADAQPHRSHCGF